MYPYLYVKKASRSFFSADNMVQYTWSDTQEEQAKEFGYLLLQQLQKRIIRNIRLVDTDKKITKLLLDPKIKSTLNIEKSKFWQKKQLIISCDAFKILDELTDPDIIFHLLVEVKNSIRRYLEEDYSIGINFREVFLVEEDEIPPPHYRAGIDVCVHTAAEYKQHTERFSYQLAKVLFCEFCPPDEPEHQLKPSLNETLVQQYSRAFPKSSREPQYLHAAFSLKDVHFFSSALSGAYWYGVFTSITGFTEPVQISELRYLFKNSYYRTDKEVTLILKGKSYQDKEKRQETFDSLVTMLKETNCTLRVNLFLITDDQNDAPLVSLIPKTPKEEEELFYPLKGNIGYYLPAQRTEPLLYKQIHDHSHPYIRWSRGVLGDLAIKKTNPTPSKIGNYIKADKPGHAVREAKKATKVELKAKLKLSLNHALSHQENINQAQIVQEQAQENEQDQVNAQAQEEFAAGRGVETNDYNFHFDWSSAVTLESFCKALKHMAQEEIIKNKDKPMDAEPIGDTQFYLKKNSNKRFYEELARDKHARIRFAATQFGYAIPTNKDKTTRAEQRPIKLPHFGVDRISKKLIKDIYSNAENLNDGLPSKRRTIKNRMFYGKVLNSIRPSYRGTSLTLREFPPFFSTLRHFTHLAQGTHASSPPIDWSILFHEEELASLSPEERTKLLTDANCLLSLFLPHEPLSEKEIHNYENKLVNLIRFYFPDRHDDLARLSQFISTFEIHNEDNLRILLHLIMKEHHNGADVFLNLLLFFEQRGLLSYFYKLYFKYAHHSSSLVLLSEYRSHSIFLATAQDIPANSTPEQCDPYVSFRLNLLLYNAKNNIKSSYYFYEQIKYFLKTLSTKLYAYCSTVEEAELLRKELVKNLGDPLEGLAIGSLSQIETFFDSLNTIIDHAREKHCLEEQIAELKNLSLLPMDAVYALCNNQCSVISQDMVIRSSEINPITLSYAVSRQELHEFIQAHNMGSDELKMNAMRHLGGLSLRQKLSHYRELHQKVTQDKEQGYIQELLWAFYILESSGERYQAEINEPVFTRRATLFLQQHPGAKNLEPQQSTACITTFLGQLRTTATQEQEGHFCLWRIWHDQHVAAFTVSEQPIPEIFLKRFYAKNLSQFLFHHKQLIEKASPYLNKTPEVAESLICHWMQELGIATSHHMLTKNMLQSFYGTIKMDMVLQNTMAIQRFFKAFSSLYASYPESLLYLSFLEMPKDELIEPKLLLIELLASVLQSYPNNKDQRATLFLLNISRYPTLYRKLPQSQALLTLLLQHFLNSKSHGTSESLVKLAEQLLSLNSEEASGTLAVFIALADNDNGATFINNHQNLNLRQIKGIAQLLQQVRHTALGLKVIEHLLATKPNYNFDDLNRLLEGLAHEQQQGLLKLALILSTNPEFNPLRFIEEHKNTPLPTLKKVMHLHEVYQKDGPLLLHLLNSSSLDFDLKTIKQQSHDQNLERYEYNAQKVQEKISQIRVKDVHSELDYPLSQKEQTQLWQDYQLLMSYMQTKPIRFKIDGQTHEGTINQLDEQQFQALYKVIQRQISQGTDVHQNQLLLIALSAEALYRSTHIFPRSTQFLTLLQQLNHPGNLIHEVKTGEGKSVIVAMQAILLHGSGHTVDVATENDQLARDALNKFSFFYDYLGIPHGANVLEAQSDHQEYVASGINYSTASNLALFRSRMAIESHPLPGNPALIADEIDATLTTTVQFRLAATLDPEFNTSEDWDLLYQHILSFVKEKEIFVDNQCNSQEDVINLKNYFIAQKSKSQFITFTKRISDELLSTLIDSALVAYELEAEVDYFVVEKEVGNKVYSYAAPIISSTNRPDPKVSHSDYVQQLLHSLLNSKKAKQEHPFIIEPSAETLITTSAKNFFDYYRKNKGPIVGLTGTAGSSIERKEFYDLYDLQAVGYPTFHPDRSKDLGLIASFGQKDHLKTIDTWLNEHKKNHPNQPILLITRSPQFTEQLHQYLANNNQWRMQSYHGYEESGKNEEYIIISAGDDSCTTIANQSLARGADINPNHEQGLLVINTCVDLTASELRQIQGRAARNGKPGQYLSIINAETIATPESSLDDIALAFKKHQHQISQKRQNERQKMRLLEDCRNTIVNDYLLKLRHEADKIYQQQFGTYSSIADHHQLFSDLSRFNSSAEKHYLALLEQKCPLDEEQIQTFIQTRAADYRSIVESWFIKINNTKLQFIEPTIPLEQLKQLIPVIGETKVADLRQFAGLFNVIWLDVGHKAADDFFKLNEELQIDFEPYFQNKSGFKETLGAVLEKKNIINVNDLEVQFLTFERELNDIVDYARDIPVIGYLVPTERIKGYFANYLKTTKQQIKEKRWGDIKFPEIDLTAITQWFSGISTVLAVGSFLIAGPIPYLIKSLVLPAIMNWVKNKIKKQFANTESVTIQLLIGLDELNGNVQSLLTSLFNLSNEKNLTVGMFLDAMGPLAKNPALATFLVKFLELSKNEQYIPYVRFLPELIEMFEPYRQDPFKELLKAQTLLNCLIHLAKSPTFIQHAPDNHYKRAILGLLEVNPDLFKRLKALKVSELFSLANNIGHPQFYSLLNKLPDDLSIEQLCKNLEQIPENTPESTKEALQSFLDYQTNPERVGEANKQALLNLQGKYNLNEELIRAELANLEPKKYPPIADPIEEHIIQAEKNSWKKYINAKTAFTTIALTILAVYNVLFFSITLLLVSAALLTLLAYPSLSKTFNEWRNQQHAPQTDQVEPAIEEQADNTIYFPTPLSGLNTALATKKPTPIQNTHSGLRFFSTAATDNSRSEAEMESPRIPTGSHMEHYKNRAS